MDENKSVLVSPKRSLPFSSPLYDSPNITGNIRNGNKNNILQFSYSP
jgi:hypothetical protein